MPIKRRELLVTALATASMSTIGRAQTRPPIRIGLLGDMNGSYSDFGGAGSVIAARLAAVEFSDGVLDRPIEILSADYQNKPDISVATGREWIDTAGVEALVECASSSSALALQQLTREKQRILLITTQSTSDLTNKACSPFAFHFNSDTYGNSHCTTRAITTHGESWFFITVDYAFGHALERDASRFVRAAGGTIVGSVYHPVDTTDFSSYLLTAQASGASVIGSANAGSDLRNAVKQATEFGLQSGGQRVTSLNFNVSDVEAIGLELGKGLLLTTSFYGDLTDATRAWTKRFRERRDRAPTAVQAAAYSSVRHFLRAVQIAGTTSGPAVAAAMRATRVNDMYNADVVVRGDGRVLTKLYLMQVKSPAESLTSDDLLKVISASPGEELFRPVDESECPLLKP